MEDYINEQERYCLLAKYLCDSLRTQLFMIDSFKNDYEYYSNKLDKIKSLVDDIYWKL